jgi:hypothetical protein
MSGAGADTEHPLPTGLPLLPQLASEGCGTSTKAETRAMAGEVPKMNFIATLRRSNFFKSSTVPYGLFIKYNMFVGQIWRADITAYAPSSIDVTHPPVPVPHGMGSVWADGKKFHAISQPECELLNFLFIGKFRY